MLVSDRLTINPDSAPRLPNQRAKHGTQSSDSFEIKGIYLPIQSNPRHTVPIQFVDERDAAIRVRRVLYASDHSELSDISVHEPVQLMLYTSAINIQRLAISLFPFHDNAQVGKAKFVQRFIGKRQMRQY